MNDAREQDAGAASPRILYCRCAYAQVVPAEVKDAVLEGLSRSPSAVEMVPDLCEMAARRDPQARSGLRQFGQVRIAACWPRAVQGLFHLADAPLPSRGVEILNMRTDSAESVLAALLRGPGEGGAETAQENPA